MSVDYALALHGGAGVIPRELDETSRTRVLHYLESALGVGLEALGDGMPALAAVERVVVFLEDCPWFNAGRGSVFNVAGEHELEASIMDGRTLACGAVVGVRTVRNPVSLARLVMDRTPHVALFGDGAEAFAGEMGVARVEPGWFDTERRRRHLEEFLEAASRTTVAGGTGTVGCVARDRDGHVAAATSTGGRTGKRVGRMGDTPVIGAGTYASDRSCAVSGTGIGEEFVRHVVAREVAALMEYCGLTLAGAAEEVVLRRLRPGDGGLVAVSRTGEIAMAFNSEGMYRAAGDSAGHFELAI